MHSFHYRNGKLHCEQVSVDTIARRYGTPAYIYSQSTLQDHFRRLDTALDPSPHLVCFAVKSNSNLAVLRSLAALGSGFDVVSEGELRRVLAAGGKASQCLFAGVGKADQEIEFALRNNIYSLNVESEPELLRISKIARRLKKQAPIAIRINPNVDAQTHAKITTGTYQNKFGVPFEDAEALYTRASKLPNLKLRGLQMHIGSQLTDVTPFERAVTKIVPLAKTLSARYGFEFISIGGGLGIVYDPALESGSPQWWKSKAAKGILTPQLYADRLLPLLKPLNLRIAIEPGRFISGNAGILVTRVQYIKKTKTKNFIIVDAAMNDLIRPSFYDAYHQIVPVHQTHSRTTLPSDVVGPICESGDFFCKDRALPPLKEGDLIALLSAGAYSFVMACNYNSRPLPPEILVHRRQAHPIRQRQPLSDLWASESVPSWLR